MPRKRKVRWTSKNYEVNRNAYLLLTYGITSLQYEAMKLKQGGCGICGKVLRVKKYCVDHDHVTGKVRGLLCSRCNKGLGYFGDNLAGIKKAYEYLLRV